MRRGLKRHLQRYKQQDATRNMTYAICGADNARGARGASGAMPVYLLKTIVLFVFRNILAYQMLTLIPACNMLKQLFLYIKLGM